MGRLPFAVRRLREERASTAPALALLAVPLTIAMGGANDYINAETSRRSLQDGTDAAALAIVPQAPTLTTAQLTSAATPYVEAKHRSAGADVPVVSTRYDSTTQSVTVDASTSVKTSFLTLAGIDTIAVTASSTAATSAKRWPICVLITDPTSKHTLQTAGSARVDFSDCMVQVNTRNADAVEAKDGSYIHSENGENCFVGDIHFGDVTPKKNPSCTFFKDPLAGLSMPASAGTCNFSSTTVNGSGVVLQPGTYCGNTVVNAGQVTFAPGVYVIKSGVLSIIGNSQVTAKGVTLLFTGQTPGFSMADGASLAISPTTTGRFAGIAAYYDTASNPRDITLAGNAKINGSGIFYFNSANFQMKQFSKMVIAPGSFVAAKLLPDDYSVVGLAGALGTSTSNETAMQKVSENSSYRTTRLVK